MLKLISMICFLFSMNSYATVSEEVDAQATITLQEATEKVNTLLKNSSVAAKEFFCLKNDLTCRVHYTLADSEGKILRAFYVKFLSADRSNGSQGYFFPVSNAPGFYIRFEDMTFDGKVNIDKIESKNIVYVIKSKTGRLAFIKNLIAPKLGTTKYAQANLTVGAKAAVLEGVLRDTENPESVEPIRIEYLRTNFP